MVMDGDLALGGEYTMRYTDDVYRIVHLKLQVQQVFVFKNIFTYSYFAHHSPFKQSCLLNKDGITEFTVTL